MPPPPNNRQPFAVDIGRQVLASVKLDDEDKEFLASFFELPWFIDAVTAFAILHWREAIRARQFGPVAAELEAWANSYGMFHPDLLPPVRRVFLLIIVVTASQLIAFQEEEK